MDADATKNFLQTTIALAALLNLLEQKGLITESEFVKEYERAKRVVVKETLKEIKKQL